MVIKITMLLLGSYCTLILIFSTVFAMDACALDHHPCSLLLYSRFSLGASALFQHAFHTHPAPLVDEAFGCIEYK